MFSKKSKKKYELTEVYIMLSNGVKLYQIKALRSFGTIKAGDLGGFIESEKNLSQKGNSWVYWNALVYGDARVYENAQVFGNAQVYENAEVYGNAWVYEDAKVHGDAKVYGNERVFIDLKKWR